ncbi:PepSY domain-containing protein [Sphingobium aquiterrae]|uniref:PepSY domain-containing protein n=1 Tax=Sphingobium aquiterrae TaxID=2038656 RepID=UPI00301ADC93
MRRWHKLLAPFFAFFVLLLAVTGLAIQATDLLDSGPAPTPAPAASVVAKAAPAPTCVPEKPKRTPLGAWNHWLKHIHSGEVAGPAGLALNLASGAALLFFAASGFWMYLQMWLRRRRASARSAARATQPGS